MVIHTLYHSINMDWTGVESELNLLDIASLISMYTLNILDVKKMKIE